MSEQVGLTQRSPAPEMTDDQRPVFFMGGFGYGEARNEHYAAYIRSLARTVLPPLPDQGYERGLNKFRITDSADNAVKKPWLQAMRGVHKPGVKTSISDFQVNRASQIAQHLESQADGPIDMIAQSADAMAALLYIRDNPGKVASLLLVCPAGIAKQPKFFRAAHAVLRSSRKSKVDKITGKMRRDDFESTKERRRNKKLGGFAMATSVAFSDMLGVLREVREQQSDLHIGMVLGTRDSIVQPADVLAVLDTDDVDTVVIADMPHGVNGRRDVMDIALEQLTQSRDEGRQSLVDKIQFVGNVSKSDQEQFLAIAGQRIL